MTLQQLYENIDGNYEQALRVMKTERLIDKYVRRFEASRVGEALAEAGQAMDGVRLFENAHAMKGVCANLGLDELARAANEITEEFRPGNPRTLSDGEVRQKLDAIDRRYRMTVEGIRKYTGEA